MSRRVVNAEGVRRDDHFRAVDGIDRIESPNLGHGPAVDPKRDAEGQEVEETLRGQDAGSK